ncbi:MAG: hypothetical protein ACLFNS_02205 [Desulfobacterales bacterium]
MSDFDFSDWLAGDEGDRLLTQIASKLSRQMHLMPKLCAALEIDQNTESEPDIRLILKSELYVFIRDKSSNLSRQLFAAGSNRAAYLLSAFVNHLIDKQRNKADNPYGYLYKRAGDVLRNDERFHLYAAAHAGIKFSLQNTGNIEIQSLTDEHLAEIPFPTDQVKELTYEMINRKSAIIQLAEFFWHKVSELFGRQPIFIQLNDFIQWIVRNIEMPATSEITAANAVFAGNPNGQDNPGLDVTGLTPDDTYSPERCRITPQTIEKWAGNFCHQLAAKEKAIFFLHHIKGHTLAKTAGLLGYKSPSGPAYQLKQAESKLQFFLRDLPKLSPEAGEEVDEEAFSMFLGFVGRILKDHHEKSSLYNK